MYEKLKTYDLLVDENNNLKHCNEMISKDLENNRNDLNNKLQIIKQNE